MILGTDKERKTDAVGRLTEWRVGATPDGVRQLTAAGHTWLVETGAGRAAGFEDAAYAAAGAEIVATQTELYGRAELICKVKEPQPAELGLLRPGQLFFTYLHCAGDRPLLDGLLDRRVVAIALEDVRTPDGRLPLLEPMSIFAGHLAQQLGYRYLLGDAGGVGLLSGHLTGIEPAKVCVFGTGHAGEAAIRVAWGMGSRVVAFYRSNRLRAERIERIYPGVTCLQSTPDQVARALDGAHLLTNTMPWPVARRHQLLVTTEQLVTLDPHAVVLDVAAEHEGGVESSRGVRTCHAEPLVEVAGKRHYVVPNIPALAARSASLALAQATGSWIRQLAEGWNWRDAPAEDPLRLGLTCADGEILEPRIRAWYGDV